MFEVARSEKGTVLIELVASCLVLMVFFFACAETWFLVRDKLYLQRIARDGAREAVIVGGSIGAGRDKAEDDARQFFGSRASKVNIDMDRHDSYRFHSVTCSVSYPHPVFGNLVSGGEVNLNARATFGWKDEATDYE